MAPGGRFNRLLDALGERYRRRLLVELLDENPLDAEASYGDEAVSDVAKIERFHTHLPKLGAKGYITWDRPSGEIEKGPNWAEVEPIVRLLLENEHELPDDWR